MTHSTLSKKQMAPVSAVILVIKNERASLIIVTFSSERLDPAILVTLATLP